jgi:hypothetical protein
VDGIPELAYVEASSAYMKLIFYMAAFSSENRFDVNVTAYKTRNLIEYLTYHKSAEERGKVFFYVLPIIVLGSRADICLYCG